MVNRKPKTKNRGSSSSTASRSKTTQSQHQSRIFEDVVGLAETLLRSRKEYGAEKLHAVAEATREYAASIPNLPTISEQVNLASETMQEFAEYIVHSDVEQMIEDAGSFARRRPLTTLCVTMAAGLAATRMFMPLSRTRNIRTKATRQTQRKSGVKRAANGATHLHV